MAHFTGTKEEFNTFLSGYCRNKVQSLTKSKKDKQKKVCQYCFKPKKSLESAHVHAFERKDIIDNILNSYVKSDGLVDVDLLKFEEEYKKAHTPVENHFYFLCHDCHLKYDNDELTDDMITSRIKMKQVEVVCAVILKDNKVFCCRRGPGRALEGKYEFPGGKIESRETQEAAIVREIKEELESDISPIKYIETSHHVYLNEDVAPFNGFKIIMHAYLCNLISGSLILKEHTDSKWLSKEELDTVDWAEADKPIVEMIKNILPKEKN